MTGERGSGEAVCAQARASLLIAAILTAANAAALLLMGRWYYFSRPASRLIGEGARGALWRAAAMVLS